MSLGWLGTFRIGQWKDLRRTVLNERRDVELWLSHIGAELRRIGDIQIVYSKEITNQPQPDGNTSQTEVVSERRTALYVTEGSSLEKLLRAYIVAGGNPLDISMFLRPDSNRFQDGYGLGQDPNEESRNLTGYQRIYPHDGIVAPMSPASFNPSGGVYEGGFLTWGKYPWRKIQDKIQDGDVNAPLASRMDHFRRWCQQSLFEKRLNLEAKIIKLMDLREQLEEERDTWLSQSVGGSTRGTRRIPDDEYFHPDFHVTAIDETINRICFQELSSGGFNPAVLSEDRFNYTTVLDDEPGDEFHAL